MEKIFENESKDLRVTKEETPYKKNKFIRFRWKKMWLDKEDVIAAHEEAAKVAKKEGIDTYIADVYESKPPLKPEVIAWWADWSIFLQKIGIKRIIQIQNKEDLKKRALNKLLHDQWELESKRTGIKHTHVKNPWDIYGEIDKK